MASDDCASRSPSTSSINVRKSPSPESTERCDLCDLSFDNITKKKAHILSLIHHVRLETKFKPCWHRCSPCKFSCDVLADYSKHIDTEEHKKKLETAGKKWRTKPRKSKKKQQKLLTEPEGGPSTSSATAPLQHPPLISSLIDAEFLQPTPSHSNFHLPPGVPFYDPSRPPPLFGMTRPPSIQAASPSPTISFGNLNFPRNTPRIAGPESTPNQGRSSRPLLPTPPGTFGISSPRVKGCITVSKKKKQKLIITRDNRPSASRAGISEKASKPTAVLIQAKRRNNAINDTVSTKRRKIVAEADSTTPLRMVRPPTVVAMANPESAAAKQSRWEKIALKSQALFLKSKSARMLKERLQKYRLVKPNSEGVSSSDTQMGAYHRCESPTASTATMMASSSLSTSTTGNAADCAILAERLSEIISSPVNSTPFFECDLQQVVQEVDEAVNSMVDSCFTSPRPSTSTHPHPPAFAMLNQNPPEPLVPVESALVDSESHVVPADSLMSKGKWVVKEEPVRVKEEPVIDEIEVIVTDKRVKIHQSTPLLPSLPSQSANFNQSRTQSSSLIGNIARPVPASERWTSQTGSASSSIASSSAPTQPMSTAISTNPGSRILEELWLLCQSEQQKNSALAEANERINRLRNQLDEALSEQLQLESELQSISLRKKDLLALGMNSFAGEGSHKWFVFFFRF